MQMQVAFLYWQRITEALLHVHEKKLQTERSQQVELHFGIISSCYCLCFMIKTSLLMLEVKKHS